MSGRFGRPDMRLERELIAKLDKVTYDGGGE
jgi:hypothetical protein